MEGSLKAGIIHYALIYTYFFSRYIICKQQSSLILSIEPKALYIYIYTSALECLKLRCSRIYSSSTFPSAEEISVAMYLYLLID